MVGEGWNNEADPSPPAYRPSRRSGEGFYLFGGGGEERLYEL